ncbi:hypothetical protein A5674_20735 [Mycobacterium malmoense]|uniref:hypothetical protein n=1 Tax=Mycobacterium malmoense TaxID=1780 RepID=UPI00080BDEE3|nr:hypothetical protein [Mycobacterium malmoense]OCB25680.1 hypothetical protein A5674_20735 [Mycobacterium malmoense]
MTIEDTATESRWWNDNTTFTELARRHATKAGLPLENVERYVADMRAHGFDDMTLRQYADTQGTDVETVYEFHAEEVLWGTETDYYPADFIARRLLKTFLFDAPEQTAWESVLQLRQDVRHLSEMCDDEVRTCALQAASHALDRLVSDEFKAVLFGLAGLDLSTPRAILKNLLDPARGQGGDPWEA